MDEVRSAAPDSSANQFPYLPSSGIAGRLAGGGAGVCALNSASPIGTTHNDAACRPFGFCSRITHRCPERCGSASCTTINLESAGDCNPVGTYAYARSPHSMLESYARDDLPIEPINAATAAQLLGRSPAELAATQFNVRFEGAQRVDLSQMRRAT